MAKHKSLRDAIREKEFRQMIEDSLKKQYQRGLVSGSRAMLRLVGDKIAEEGKTADETIAILKGNTCGSKPTSCADQFARALEEALVQEG